MPEKSIAPACRLPPQVSPEGDTLPPCPPRSLRPPPARPDGPCEPFCPQSLFNVIICPVNNFFFTFTVMNFLCDALEFSVAI